MKQSSVTVQNKIDFLVKDMGKSTFRELLHFIVEVMKDEHNVKIFMARRFLDIFLEFEEIVRYLYDDTVKKKGRFVTNLSVVTLQKVLKDQTILIVDDIRLHGRALDEVTAFLIEECHCVEKNIMLKIFVDNKDVVKIESKYQPRIEIKKIVNKNIWKKISSSIINSLYILGQPYVSHLPYFEVSSGTEAADIIEKFTNRDDVEEITTEIQKYYGVHSYLYLMEGDTYRMPFVEQNMIRIYVYGKIGKIIVVPYAFLKPLSSDGVLYYYEQLCKMKVIQEMTENQNSDSESFNEEAIQKYLYSLETYVTSLVLGEQFIIERALTGICWEKVIEKYCFGCKLDVNCVDIRSFILNLAGADKWIDRDYISTSLYLDESNEITELIASINKNSMEDFSVNMMLENYIKLSGKHDEELARQGKKRMRGMEYLRLCKWSLGVKGQELWKSIINIVDSGRGTLTISVNVVDNKSFVDSLLFAGEQNDSCNECNLIYYIYPLLEYECRCRNNLSLQVEEVNDIQNGKDEVIDLISNKFPELRKRVTNAEIEHLRNTSIVNDGLDYYTSRYPIYEQDERLEQVLDATRFIGKE